MIDKLIIKTNVIRNSETDVMSLAITTGNGGDVCFIHYVFKDNKLMEKYKIDEESTNISEEMKNAIDEFIENLDNQSIMNMYNESLKEDQYYTYNFTDENETYELSDSSIAISILTESVDKLNDTMSEIKNILQDYLHSYRAANNLKED